jgi:NDP-sugar pyrophosphorylase family protein
MPAPTVFFLAAGFGTRLRPLTDALPKALVPVGNEPQLLRLAQRFPHARRVANAHHLAPQLERAVATWPVALTLSVEDDVLGTAGGLRAARPHFEPGPVLVYNADIEAPHEVLVRALADVDERALATLLVGPTRPVGEGNVGLDAGRRVVRLRRSSFGVEVASCDYLGVALVSEAGLEVLPERGCLVGDAWIPALARGATLRVSAEADGPALARGSHDLGTPASYLAANLAWLDEAGLTVRAERGSSVHPDARRAVVGVGARLDAPAHDVVLWPGARLAEPLEGAIVTSEHVVRVQRAR